MREFFLNWRVMFVWLSAFGFIGIGFTACATKPAQLPPPAPVSAQNCLPLKAYTKAQQQQAADELAKLPQSSVVAQMVIDYGALRDADRACQSK